MSMTDGFGRHGISAGQRGFTLVELLVTLLVLTILAAVAVRSTSGIADQARFENTQRTLANLEDAIIGPANQRDADGTLLITGFVADMGRLPNALGADGDLDRLAELWDVGLFTTGQRYNIANTTLDNEIRLGSGWRGPYVRLPIGSGGVLPDGWGGDYATLDAAEAPVAAGQPVRIIRSAGGPSAPYNIQLDAAFEQTSASVQRHQGTVSVTITYVDTNGVIRPLSDIPGDAIPPSSSPFNSGDVTVKMYVPDVANPGQIIDLTPSYPPGSSVIIATFDNVPIGPRIVRAYWSDGGCSPLLDTCDFKSPPTPLSVMARGTTKTIALADVP